MGEVKVRADREPMGVDLDVVTLLRHPKTGVRVDGHLVQGLPERLAVFPGDLRTTFDRLRRRLADQLDPRLIDQILRHRTRLGRRRHFAIGRELDVGQAQEALSLVDKVAESNRRGESQPTDRAEQGAVDLDQEFALSNRERFNWACRLQFHPIYMWRRARSLRRRSSGLYPRLVAIGLLPDPAGNRPARRPGRG